MSWFARGLGNGMISVANQMYKENAQERESNLALQRAQMMEEFRANLQDRRASTEGTKEYEELQGLKSKNEAGRVALGEAKDAAAIKDIARGQDSQFADGSYGVVGGDGKIRMVRKDGSLIDSATDDTGAAIGKSREEFLKSLETPKDRAERELRESQKAENEAKVGYYGKLGEAATTRAEKVGSGGGRADHFDEKAEEKRLTQHDRQLQMTYTTMDPATGKSIPNAAVIEKIQLLRDKFADSLGAGAAIGFTREFVQSFGADKIEKLPYEQVEMAALAFAKKGVSPPKPAAEASPTEKKQTDTGLVGSAAKPAAPVATAPKQLSGGSLRAEINANRLKLMSLKQQMEQTVPGSKQKYDALLIEQNKLMDLLNKED